MKQISTIIAAFAASVVLTSSALAESKGKMANEWTVSKMAPKDGETEAPSKTVAGSGAGKANFQDLTLANKPTPDTSVKKKGSYLKLGPIKGESTD